MATSTEPWADRSHMLFLAFGYGISYVPYAALAKALSVGYLPGIGVHQGLLILPATAIGQLVTMPVFLWLSGWWRFGTRRMVGGRRIFFPRRDMLLAGVLMAVIVGTTTLNYTFPGGSILLMLLLMRAGTLAMSPIVDRVIGRRVPLYAWGAVGFALLSVVLALSDVTSYALTIGAVASVVAYIGAYVGRFHIMGRRAKTGVPQVDRRYFVAEHAAAPVLLLLMLAAGAVVGVAPLREGFGSFLLTRAAIPALIIGVLYEVLFVFGTLIFLDRSPYSWGVPINNVASLLSGVVASFALAAIFPAAVKGLPGPGQKEALVAVFIAIGLLAYPSVKRLLKTGSMHEPCDRRLVLFVCGGNTCRSPMAEAIAREEIALAQAGRHFASASAGVTVATVGDPMTREAIIALGELGIEVRHRSRPLDAATCRAAHVIYCMTRSQRTAVLAMAPDVANRILCLDADRDILDPAGQPLAAHHELAARLRSLVRARLAELEEFRSFVPASWQQELTRAR